MSSGLSMCEKRVGLGRAPSAAARSSYMEVFKPKNKTSWILWIFSGCREVGRIFPTGVAAVTTARKMSVTRAKGNKSNKIHQGIACTVRYVNQSQNAVDGPRSETDYSSKVDFIFWNELDNGLRGRLGLTNAKDEYTTWASLALIFRACAQNERSNWGVAEVKMHRQDKHDLKRSERPNECHIGPFVVHRATLQNGFEINKLWI